MKILAVDPGKAVGWAFLSVEKGEDVKLLSFGIVQHSELSGWISEHMKAQTFKDIQAIVMEDYQVLPSKAMAHAGSKLETTRAIGQLELLSSLTGAKLVKSSAANNNVNMKLAGVSVKGKSHKDTHWVYAYAHGYAFLTRLHLAMPKAHVRALQAG